MFGSTNHFGQPSSGPLGSQSVFQQLNYASNNAFVSNTFGGTKPFSSETGSSIFGGNSTGLFGTTQSSPFRSSTHPSGTSPTPAFGSSGSGSGVASTPFGSSSSAFGGLSSLGKKPACGGFGSTQTSLFGSKTTPQQPEFGSSPFGSSTTLSTTSQSAFGAPNTSTTIGRGSGTLGFGVSSSNGFSGTPAFGISRSSFLSLSSSSTLGQPISRLGSSLVGVTSPSFALQNGARASTQTSGSSGLGKSNLGIQRGGSRVTPYKPTIGKEIVHGKKSSFKILSISAMPIYHEKSHDELRFEDYRLADKGGSKPPIQSASVFNFGTSSATASSTLGQSSPFATAATFKSFPAKPCGSTVFGPNLSVSLSDSSASLVTNSLFGPTSAPALSANSSTSLSSTSTSSPLTSISPSLGIATPSYSFTTQSSPLFSSTACGSKPPIQSASVFNFGTSSATASSTLGQSSPFATATTFKSFPAKPCGSTVFGPNLSVSLSGSSASLVTNSLFGPTSAPALSANSSTSLSSTSTSSPLTSISPSLGIATPSYSFATQSSPLFSSTAQSFAQTVSPFGQTTALIGQTASPAGQTYIQPLGQTNTSTASFIGSRESIFSSSQSLFQASTPARSNPSLPSMSTPFQSTQPADISSTFILGNCSQTKNAHTSDSADTQNIGQNNLGNSSTSQSSLVQSIVVTNPFGTLPAAPQMSIGQNGKSCSSIQYGISSMPVANKTAPVQTSSLLTIRKLSQRPLRLPLRRYHPNADHPKVPFFVEGEASTPKADAYIIPRENPRALVICPTKQWPSRMHGETQSPSKDVSRLKQENELQTEDCLDRAMNMKESEKANDVRNSYPGQDGDLFKKLKANLHADAIAYEHGDDIEALMPKLHLSDYYTEPAIQELATKEKAEPGFCSHVHEFVIGRQSYGSIKFVGYTDVRHLDLESIVQFNNREVIVYLDKGKKPPVGQGLNKPAVVTLLNIKCVSKKTGQHYVEGPNTEKYREILKKKAKDQGAEFVSYNPLKGEWKFRVDHF